jgi:hypothetical protein
VSESLHEFPVSTRRGHGLVVSRAAPLLLHVESGFPHGKFQFISFAGTAWAAMAKR